MDVRVKAVNETGILVKYFSKIGGNNLTEFVERCLAPLVKDELAIQFTYLGRKGKLNFGVSNLAKAIVDAAKKTNFISNRKETDISIGPWLRRALERKRRSTILI
ncbi:hypothetical protein JTB14_035303 [Gonioctena quinquepunctata]|nr:hypothetical protein JTB14_035303 [Gonioctena quinquepunctata]